MTDTISPSKKPFKLPLMLAVMGVCVLALFFWLRPAHHTEVTNEDNTPKVYKKMVYEVANWQFHPKLTGEDKFERILAMLGVGATKDDTLDFNGAKANKYSYTSGHEPPLYVVDSDKLFELSWYHAHPKDSDEVKAVSIRHAQKAYGVAGALWGNEGKTIIEHMLNEQAMEVKLLKSHRLLKAQCANYTCQMVMEK